MAARSVMIDRLWDDPEDEDTEALWEVFHDDEPPIGALALCHCTAVVESGLMRRPDVPYEACEVLMCPACAAEVEELWARAAYVLEPSAPRPARPRSVIRLPA